MIKYLTNTLLIVITLYMVSCVNKDSNIQIEVREVDFLNKTGDVLHGNLVGEFMGMTSFQVCDTFMLVGTTDPNGMLKVYNLNNMNFVGEYIKKGRARNEMLKLLIYQTDQRDGHATLWLYDFVKQNKIECDVTECVKQGKTVFGRSVEDISEKSQTLILDNNPDNLFKWQSHFYVNEKGKIKCKKTPCSYTLIKDGNKRDYPFFQSVMKVEKASQTELPYDGSFDKHPKRNLLVQRFTYMDYLLFMDIDNDHYFAVHQEGSLTYGDSFKESALSVRFLSGTFSDKYYMVLYINGDYSKVDEENEMPIPELLVFDYDGNYVAGFKMDRAVSRVRYDMNHDIIYAITTDEKVYAYNMEKVLQ